LIQNGILHFVFKLSQSSDTRSEFTQTKIDFSCGLIPVNVID